jgi:hypothetical protein
MAIAESLLRSARFSLPIRTNEPDKMLLPHSRSSIIVVDVAERQHIGRNFALRLCPVFDRGDRDVLTQTSEMRTAIAPKFSASDGMR